MTRLTRQQVRQIDRLSIERYGIPGIVLMENASRAAADVAHEMLQCRSGAGVLILCGGGNNGGDGLAIARHLHNRGFAVEIALTTAEDRFTGDALINFNIARKMNLKIGPVDIAAIHETSAALIVDAIFGTGLSQAPRDPFAEIVAAVTRSGKPVLAIDVPSGLDCDTGQPLDACITATRTITFVAEKIGFANPTAKQYLGEVIIGDIGSPKELIDEVLEGPH